MQRGGVIAGIVISRSHDEVVKEYTIQINQVDGGESSLMDPMGMKNRFSRHIRDEKGKFEINKLSPGAYELTFKAEGFADRELDKITIGSGENARGIIVALPDESCICGVVLDKLTRDPVCGANISLKSGLISMIESITDESASYSDEYGCFKLGGLSQGSVHVTVNHPQYKELKLGEIVLIEGEALEGIEVLLSKGSMIKGYVRAADNKPLPGENIMAANSTGTKIKHATTLADGYYELSGFPKGIYNVTLMPKSMAFDGDDFISSLMKDIQTKIVTLEEDQAHQCDFIVGGAGAKGVRVHGVVREGGIPAKGVIMQLFKGGDINDSHAPKMTSTNKDGEYSFLNIAPGDYSFIASRTPKEMTAGAFSAVVYEIKIPDRIDFKYDVDLPFGSITGTIKDKNTLLPLKMVRIILLKDDEIDSSSLMSKMMKNRVSEVYTSESGHFNISNIQDGNYLIRAGGSNLLGMNSGGYAHRLIDDIKISKGENKENVRIYLEKGGVLEGTVTDIKGLPVIGAAIHMKGPANRAFESYTECITDSSGFYSYKGLNPGECSIMVKHSDYSKEVDSGVWIEKGMTTTLNFTLKK